MDTNMDNPSFDLQSTHVSYEVKLINSIKMKLNVLFIEERHWLNEQRHLYKLDNLVKSIGDLHKTIRGCQQC